MSTSNSISGQRIRARKMLTLAAGAGLVFAALPAASYAADVNWNVADGNWDADASWLGGVKPTAADRAVLNNATAGSTARVTTLVTSSPTTTHEGVTGVVVTASNILSIEAGGEILTGTVGADLADATFGIHIGDGGVGSATVTGNGRLVAQGNNIGGSLFIGQAGGTGALTVNHADARAEGNDVMIGGANIGGTASPGTATLTLSAGTVQARAWSFVGRDGGTGTLDFTGGTFLTGGQH